MDAATRIGLQWMLEALEANQLIVELNPAPEQCHATHFIRVATSTNANWYRAFCAAYPTRAHSHRWKHPDTKIKRQDTIRILRHLIKHGTSTSKYAPDLCEIATRMYNEVLYGDAEHEPGEPSSEEVPF
jgi:hypothetical protein